LSWQDAGEEAMFARNHWYVVALSSEIGHEPLARTVLGEPVVLYRGTDGTPVALADRCPHRRYPLSLGRLDGDLLVCGYHGFTFDCSGTCVAVPGQDAIPSRANVRPYPLVESGAWTWIWMGHPDVIGRPEPPATPWLQAGTEWAVTTSMAPLPARHELLVDNLLDLSHETYLHAGFIGTPEVAATPITTEVDEESAVVRVSRHMVDVECPPFYSRSTGITGRIDRWQDIEYFAPGYYLLHSRIAPTGLDPAPDGSDDEACHIKISYGITPSTPTSTYDFWAVSRDFARDDVEVDEFLFKQNATVVGQDVDALTVLEQRISADPDDFELNIKIDRGGLAARRILRQLVDAEVGESPPS
jgi:phenylpropionate dioxygenase-like ring-hydroxylating dioxygenase large terminal subunit